MSLEYVHIRSAQGLGDIFSEVISDGTDDIIYAPVDRALRERKNRDGKYKFPFVSMWPEPAQVNADQWRHKLSYKTFFTFQPDQSSTNLSGTEMRLFPVSVTYNCEYWEEDNRRRLDKFNQEFVKNARTGNTYDLSLPFKTPDGEDITGLKGDEIGFNQQYQFSDITDNSDLEFNTQGVEYRWSFQLQIDSWFFEAPAINDDVIEEIIIEYFDRDNVASQLIESGTVS